MLNLLNELHGVLKAVLFLQLLDLGLAVLDEGGSINRSAVVGLLVVLHDLLQLCPALVGLFWSMLSGKLMMNSRCLGIRAFIIVISLFLSFSINQLFIQKRSALPRDLRKNGYSPNTRRAFAAVVRNTSSGASALRWAMYAPT